mgnify:CR=1 FL=1
MARSRDEIDEIFQRYRKSAVSLCATVITLVSLIWGWIAANASIVQRPSRLVWLALISLVLLAIALGCAVWELYCLFLGQYREANRSVGQDMGSPNIPLGDSDTFTKHAVVLFLWGFGLFVAFFLIQNGCALFCCPATGFGP